MTVSSPQVSAASAGNNLTFTYTAAATGISDGEVDVAVPNGWTAPQKRRLHTRFEVVLPP